MIDISQPAEYPEYIQHTRCINCKYFVKTVPESNFNKFGSCSRIGKKDADSEIMKSNEAATLNPELLIVGPDFSCGLWEPKN